MKIQYENLGSLLDQTAARQLAEVDSEKLYADLRQRLDNPEKTHHPYQRQSLMHRWAVGLAAAAIVTVICFVSGTKPGDVGLPDGQCAAVKLIESKTQSQIDIRPLDDVKCASVVIQPLAQKVQVTFAPSGRQIAQCDVTIIDQNGHTQKEKNRRPSWIILISSQTQEPGNSDDCEQADIACLL